MRKTIAESREAAKTREKLKIDNKPGTVVTPRKGPGGKLKISAVNEFKENQEDPKEATLPVLILPDTSCTPQKVDLPLEADTPQVDIVDTPQAVMAPVQPPEEGGEVGEEGVPLDLNETVVTQILAQPTQLFLNNSTLPGTVFIQQQGDTQDGTVVPTTLANSEQVFVMNQQPEIQEEKGTGAEPTMIISQDALPPNVAMYEHEGQTYAFVLETALPPGQ